ncbi:hypothetical protein EJB05_28785 [Eragrostis curvula]|uniref:Uncharacterized protein n=1 Tax=Eragrostis curvula TaxID=38414 RepID=A0A5J9USE1_9POAL|nr:hypothetical protein EJB05_28785 [Eragrostis curvula]
MLILYRFVLSHPLSLSHTYHRVHPDPGDAGDRARRTPWWSGSPPHGMCGRVELLASVVAATGRSCWQAATLRRDKAAGGGAVAGGTDGRASVPGGRDFPSKRRQHLLRRRSSSVHTTVPQMC